MVRGFRPRTPEREVGGSGAEAPDQTRFLFDTPLYAL